MGNRSVPVEDEQQRLLMRERHPGPPGVALDLGGERVVVAARAFVSAVAGEVLSMTAGRRLGMRT